MLKPMSKLEKWAQLGCTLTLHKDGDVQFSSCGEQSVEDLLGENWTEFIDDHTDILEELLGTGHLQICNNAADLTLRGLLYAAKYPHDFYEPQRFVRDGNQVVTYLKRPMMEAVHRTNWRKGGPKILIRGLCGKEAI